MKHRRYRTKRLFWNSFEKKITQVKKGIPLQSEIISVGTELLLGHITDTNSSWLAKRQAELGINCMYISQIDDNINRLAEQIERSWLRSDLIIITGGLGPTEDDLTREAVSCVFGESLITDDKIEKKLSVFFERRHVKCRWGIKSRLKKYPPVRFWITRLDSSWMLGVQE